MTEVPLPDKEPACLDELMDRCRPVHFVGIGGVGMAGLAYLLHQRGVPVSGCDSQAGPLVSWLRDAGVKVSVGHDPEHVRDGVAWVVFTPAVSKSSPELAAARDMELPVFRRGDVLASLFHHYPCKVAVAGTHGKTTTSTFLAQMLHLAGKTPDWCIGGQAGQLESVAGRGDGSVLVIEADESDGSLVNYRADVALITNVEFDHMEHFADREEFEACFHRFAAQAAQGVIYGADDARAARIARQAARSSRSFGLSGDADVRATAIVENARGTAFDWCIDGERIARAALAVPGRHNLLNALAASAVCLELGVGADQILEGFGRLDLPRRRLEVVAAGRGVEVISDYAHHPTEIAACIQALRSRPSGRLVAIFQPHRYTRTLALGPDFPAAFHGLDELTLVPVYAASEAPIEGGDTWDLYGHVAAWRGRGTCRVAVADALDQAWKYWQHQLKEGDLLLLIGAGDVEKLGPVARDSLAESARGDLPPGGVAAVLHDSTVRADEPLSAHTTLRVGGRADTWIELGSVEDARSVLGYAERHGIELQILGRGSNVLAHDLGFRGMVVCPAGGEFIHCRYEENAVIAGAGVAVGALLNELQTRGLGGLEFLDGIPASIGGCARMNAGAFGGEIKNHVLWIRGLNRDGSLCIVDGNELDWRYRSCATLQNVLVVDVALAVSPGRPVEIAASRRKVRDRRRWMSGLRSAGSVFKNPREAPAGRLLEEAGAKSMQVGGALVSSQHANVIVTQEGATSSDVRALIRKMRNAVQVKSGVNLEPEIRIWECG